ncbi:MAG: protease modulator HflC, partial [Rhodospirillaceae bacterium]|nr:protease modulator HflC [Rhodospirillaceae bacterium]
QLMTEIRDQVNRQSTGFGVDVIDVRIRRADLPEENSQAVYQRMQTEREREAKEFRAQGEEESQRIRSRADRERVVLIAEAERESQTLRGEGDEEALRISRDAYGRDSEFYAFYRAMQAYRVALGDGDTSMVLSPDSEFFRFFDDIVPPQAPAPAATE